MNKSVPGLIYYALDATGTRMRVKIGFTQDLRKRMTALRQSTMSRQSPIVLAVEPGTLNVETERHVEFAMLHVVGEWFRLEDPLTGHMKRLGDPFEYLLDHPDLIQFARGWCQLKAPITPEVEDARESFDPEDEFDDARRSWPDALARIRAIKDPTDRARAAQEVIADVTAVIARATTHRDDMIRTARRQGASRTTIKALADAVGVKPNVVVDALRTPRQTQ